MVKIDHGWTGRLHPSSFVIDLRLDGQSFDSANKRQLSSKGILVPLPNVSNGPSVAGSMTSVTERYDDKSLDYVGWVAV